MIEIDLITPSHDSLRDLHQIDSMVEFVRNGGFFTKEALQDFAEQNNLPRSEALIQLVKLDDGMILNHDGHHRTLAVLLGGRDYLHTTEYFLVDRTYQMYEEINFDADWVTPFDPRQEIRISDFFGFKDEALRIAKECEDKARSYIRSNRHTYTVPRGSIRHILDLKPVE